MKIGCERKKIKEVVYDLEEFKKLLSTDNSRVHYELYWKPLEHYSGLITRLEAGIRLYGISVDGYILVCELSDEITWCDKRLKKYGNTNLFDDYDEWIKEKWNEYKKIAEELGATPGKFEYW